MTARRNDQTEMPALSATRKAAAPHPRSLNPSRHLALTLTSAFITASILFLVGLVLAGFNEDNFTWTGVAILSVVLGLPLGWFYLRLCGPAFMCRHCNGLNFIEDVDRRNGGCAACMKREFDKLPLRKRPFLWSKVNRLKAPVDARFMTGDAVVREAKRNRKISSAINSVDID